MKRPVTLVLAFAALLATGSAFAKDQSKDSTTKAIAAAAARSHDHRGHDGKPRYDRPRDHGKDHGKHAPPSRGLRNDSGHRDHDRNHNGRNDRWDHYRRDWNRHPNYWDNRRHDRADYARYRFHFGTYHAPRGYYHRVWRRGDHLPRGWYARNYIVYDWRPYRLYAPPYGYHWVRVGNDVLLTAVATGIVLDVIYDIWY
ncbi:MAG TPA: RcnB family protein [Steroidobacteraceae bacterium]|nr:RcnB family protein [Steroidobacteraceae bacterium]